MQEFLRAGDCTYGCNVARPLGMNTGVPPVAGDVDLEGLLRQSDPRLAEQVSDPAALLLPMNEWPDVVPKVRSMLAKDYAQFVERNVAVGLQYLGE